MSEKVIKLMVEGGKASGGPPLGPALGPMGINIQEVVNAINEATKAFAGLSVPVNVVIDTKTKSFTIEVGAPPTSQILKQKAGVEKGHGKAWKEGSIGNVSLKDIVEMAKGKSNSLGKNVKATVKEIIGTALSMGLTVEGKNPREVQREIDENKHDSLFAA